MFYEIKRDSLIEGVTHSVTVATIRPEGVQIKEVMGQNIVTMTFKLPYALELHVQDYVIVYREKYRLNTLPDVDKISQLEYAHSCTFEGIEYEAAKAKFFFYNSSNKLIVPDFSVTGTIEVFLDLAIANLNRRGSGWVKGNFIESDTRTITFSQANVLSALYQTAEEFGTECWFEGQTVHLRKKDDSSGKIFQYGKCKGLRRITRSTIDSENIVTVLYPYGSTKNLPAGYHGGDRLVLPASMEFLSKNTGRYGEIEQTMIFEEIFPKRIGTVTSVGAYNIFSDSTIPEDLDVIKCLIAGTSAKVKFQTGQLAGYSLEIRDGGYAHSTRTFVLNQNKEEKAIEVPSEYLKPAIGDTYIVEDIIMPQSYISTAEAEVKLAGEKYLNENADPRVQFSTEPDFFYLRDQETEFELGKRIRVKEEDFRLNADLRVIAYERDLHEPYLYTRIDVSDKITVTDVYTQIQRLTAEAKKTERIINLNRLSDPARARNNRKTAQETLNMMFNPETGFMYSEKIAPFSISTLQLAVGAKSNDFQLTVLFKPNFNADVNQFAWSDGKLIHFQIDTIGGQWDIEGGSYDNLDPSIAYYVYARCSTNEPVGTMIISTDQITVEQEQGWYNFTVGVLNSVIGGYRTLSTTYGTSEINGGQIRTGAFVNSWGEMVLDLDNRVFYGAFKFADGRDVETELGETKEAAQEAVDKTRFLTTSIEGDTVITGKVLVGDAEGNNNAGISGETDQGNKSVRYFAGAPYASKNTARWRVLDDGSSYQANATISSSEDGKRIEISGEENRLRLYNDQDQVILEIDDDSAVEVLSEIAAIYGPGISIGSSPQDALGFSSLGRKGIFTTGNFVINSGSVKKAELSKDGLVAQNYSINAVNVGSGTLTITNEGAILITGPNVDLILPENPNPGRTLTVNVILGSFRIKSSNRSIKDRGDTIGGNVWMDGITWGRTFTYFAGVNAWVCTGYLN